MIGQRIIRKRKTMAVTLVILMVLFGFLSYRTSSPHEDDPVWTRIQTTGEIRFCLDPSFPPFESMDETTGQLRGFDVDLGKEIARRLELAATFVPTGFDGLYDALTANTCDLVLSAFPYDPRQTEDYLFSIAYFNAGQVLVVPAGDTQTRSIRDLAGKEVAVEWGSDGDITIRQWGRRIPLTPYPAETPDEALQAVSGGRAQAALVDAISAYVFVHQHPALVVSATVTEDHYVLVLSPGAYTLIGHINAILQDMREDGFLAALQNRWF